VESAITKIGSFKYTSNLAIFQCNESNTLLLHRIAHLAAYKAIRPAMKGMVINAMPAIAIGIFS
jgi:hypothetical protein